MIASKKSKKIREMEAFFKVVCLGKAQGWNRRGDEVAANVFCKIEFNDQGKLSISGVVGPTPSGNALGFCGQINDTPILEPNAAEGWTQELIAEFYTVWSNWHLNDMQAGCEHQRSWVNEEVEIAEYMLRTEIFTQQRAIMEQAEIDLKEKGFASISKHNQKLLNLEIAFKAPHDRNDKYVLTGEFASYYALKGTEKKTLSWLTEEQHPRGFLSKACPECGYKYGTKWLFKEVPHHVLNFLRHTIKATEIPYAWV